MEKTLSTLQLISHKFFGISLFQTFNIKLNLIKTISFVIFMIIYVSFGIHGIFFNQLTHVNVKFVIICTILGSSSILLVFVDYWRNNDKFRTLINWIQERYQLRSFVMVNEVSKDEYGKCEIRMWKVTK